jgi:hypothetical protein
VNEKASVFSIENILADQRTFLKTNESKLNYYRLQAGRFEEIVAAA